MPDLEKISKLLGLEVANKIYDDAVSPAAKEIGAGAADVVKGLRLFTLPFALMAQFREKVLEDLQAVRDRVPVERQIDSPPEIAGPILEKLRFLSDDNPLRAMYLNLLAASIDKENQKYAHPAFIRVIGDLSALDVKVLDLVDKREGKRPYSARMDSLQRDMLGMRDTEIVHVMQSEIDAGLDAAAIRLAIENLNRLNLIEDLERIGIDASPKNAGYRISRFGMKFQYAIYREAYWRKMPTESQELEYDKTRRQGSSLAFGF